VPVEFAPIKLPERLPLAVEKPPPLAGDLHGANNDFPVQRWEGLYSRREDVGPFNEHGNIYRAVLDANSEYQKIDSCQPPSLHTN